MSRKQLWLLVGGNGAGKSTFFELFLKPRKQPFVNADRIARTLAPEGGEDVSYEAAVVAERMRQDLLEHPPGQLTYWNRHQPDARSLTG